jgi:hypothetical protein
MFLVWNARDLNGRAHRDVVANLVRMEDMLLLYI